MRKRKHKSKLTFGDWQEKLSAIDDGGEFLSQITNLISCQSPTRRRELPKNLRMFLALYEIDIDVEIEGLQGWFDNKVESVEDVLTFFYEIGIIAKANLLILANNAYQINGNDDEVLECKLNILSKEWRDNDEDIGKYAKKWFFSHIDSLKIHLLELVERFDKPDWELSPAEITRLVFDYSEGVFAGKAVNFIGIDRLDMVISLACDGRCKAKEFLIRMAFVTSAGIAVDLSGGEKTDLVKAEEIIRKYESCFDSDLMAWKIESQKMWANPDPMQLIAYMGAADE